jgi:hypothetical protein
MKYLLMTIAIVESTTGIALLAAPAMLSSLLLGEPLDTSAGLALARLAGAALISLGIACWFGSRDTQSPAAFGIVVAMLLYNLAAVVLLVSWRYLAGMPGFGLLPADALHSVLAVWCIVCLRTARFQWMQ